MKQSLSSTAYHSGQHCPANELLAPLPECPICGFDGQRKRVLTIQRDPDVYLLDCPNCRASSASQMPKPETLARYYSEYRQDTDSKVTFFSPARFAAHIIQLAGPRWKQPTIRILDFGGADGSLSLAIADLLARRGENNPTSIAIDLIDYSQRAGIPHHPSISVRQLSSLSETAREAYDLVIASSVMEHIPQPAPEFKALFEALAQNGCFYARTPWIVPVLQIFERLGVGFDFTYPAHVHDMGRHFWEGILRLSGDHSQVRLRHTSPSPVETRFGQDPIRTIAAYILKAPWHIAPSFYQLVGGWEVMFERVGSIQPSR